MRHIGVMETVSTVVTSRPSLSRRGSQWFSGFRARSDAALTSRIATFVCLRLKLVRAPLYRLKWRRNNEGILLNTYMCTDLSGISFPTSCYQCNYIFHLNWKNWIVSIVSVCKFLRRSRECHIFFDFFFFLKKEKKVEAVMCPIGLSTAQTGQDDFMEWPSAELCWPAGQHGWCGHEEVPARGSPQVGIGRSTEMMKCGAGALLTTESVVHMSTPHKHTACQFSGCLHKKKLSK